MSNGTPRLMALLLAFVIGGIVGWFLRARQPLPPAVARGSASILVGPTAKQLTIPRLEISKMAHDVVWWNSRDPRRELWIEFDTQIFQGMKPGTYGKFRVDCQKASCYSGAILDSAPNAEYKYWQVLVDPENPSQVDKEDGWIVIQK